MVLVLQIFTASKIHIPDTWQMPQVNLS